MKRVKQGKASHRIFRFHKDIDHWLKVTSKRTGRTMTALAEEAIRNKMVFKPFVKPSQQPEKHGE